ncbi:FHA domain-containing protein [Cystobacter fuscus]
MSEYSGIHGMWSENEGTRVRAAWTPRRRPAPLDACSAFRAAYRRLRHLAESVQGPAVLGVAVDGRGYVVEAVIVEPGHSLIIGRHTGCGLRLPSDTVSLRQLALYAQSGAPGAAPDIRLWDLNTEQLFLTEDGEPNAAVIAQGLLYAAVEEYALLFLPTRGPSTWSWPERAEEAWEALPPRHFIDQRAPSSDRRRHSRYLRLDGQEYHTNVTRLGPLMLLSGHERPEAAWGSLRLVGAEREEEHHISLARLEQGVLLGRYERCGVVLAQECLGLSRVHLLLVRMGGEVLAIDTASTNGTWRGPVEIQTTVLEDSDSLELGESLVLHWRRLPRRSSTLG